MSRIIFAAPVAFALGCLSPLAASVWADNTPGIPAASQTDPDYIAGKKAVEAEDWKTAIRLLSKAALRDDFNADIHNLLGFSYRHDGDFKQAFAHYDRALSLNPRHRGAHEYIGVAFLLQDNLAKAEEHLAALEKICLLPCEEYDDLKKEIAAYRARKSRAGAQH